MCGIAAIFAYSDRAPSVERAELLAIRDRMITRGPDGSGEWIDAEHRLGLAHRRLSIIDLSENGLQPMWNAARTVGITFNGEIYNYRTLRERLEKSGYRFSSQSDTEVLLHLYSEYGAEMVRDLRGMFAFVIWDVAKKRLFAARDPFGIKPLYYSDDGATLRLASQVKALLASGKIDTAPSPAGQAGYFLWGHMPDPYTCFRGIKGVPAGASLTVTQGVSPEIRRFFNLTSTLETAEQARSQPEERQDILRAALADTVRHHLIADVPVGVFLSSGLDSTTLVGLAAEQQQRLRTVTMGFAEYKGTAKDETILAERVAELYGTDHRTIWISQADFEQEHDRLMAAMDQPSTDGVNSYFVSLAATRAGLKVALSGLGGDELFGGYPSFTEIPKAANILGRVPISPAQGRFIRRLSAPIVKQFTSPKYAGLLEYGSGYGGLYLLRRGMFMPWELPSILEPEMARAGWEELQPIARLDETLGSLSNSRLKVSALELSWYMRNQLLRDADWASMAHSLELRVPLVDTELLQRLVPLMAGPEPVQKKEMALCPVPGLPPEILHRPKTGFSIPVREWLMAKEGTQLRGLRGWAGQVFQNYFATK